MEALDQEYKELIVSINQLAYCLSKHESIRMKLWLEKLSNPVTNLVWKQNRNLYLKVLREMAQQGSLQTPFHQTPHEGPLHKITLYDIPYPVRIKIIEEDKKIEPKSSSCHKNRSLSRRNSIGAKPSQKKSQEKRDSVKNKLEHKKKIVFDSIMVSKQQDIENIPYLSNFKNQTMRTEELHFGSMEMLQAKNDHTQKIQFRSNNPTHERALQLLRNTLKFLASHCEQLEDQVGYSQVIEKIVECGEQFGENFKITGNDSIQFQKTNQRIKQNLMRGDINSMEFLSYLDSLN